ncbi:MAG: bifunctional UDP-N-acetylglucosamine diphosphorylase/glucosamine-1-phosphate N-acetyltransferase GlmU [bacterium]
MVIQNTRVIVLAAGRSARFKTDRSKLIYSICGQHMILYPIKLLEKMGVPITVVVGYQADQIKKIIDDAGIKVDYITQEYPLGTGHAVAATRKTWDKENILIINGDSPLLSQDIITELEEKHTESNSVISFLSSHALNPFGYGRIMREKDKVSIIEDKNLTEEQRFTTLINAGIYLIKKSFLEDNIDKIEKDSEKGEYYITDLVKIASDQGLKVKTIPVPYDDVRGVNTLEELWAVEQIKRSQIIKYWMRRGVYFELAQNIHIDWDIKIGPDTFIGTGVHLIKGTTVGNKCTINAFSLVENSSIDDNSYIHSHSVIQNSKIGRGVHVGPFARLRKNVVLGDNVNIGNFVEIKNSVLGENTKAKHLAYLGDSEIGKNVNIGAGTITCNYDGIEKHKTIIKDNVFIGSNNSLIAPLTIGSGAYTAAGSTINKDVPKDSLGVARCRQENKIDYVKTLDSKKIREVEFSTTSEDKLKNKMNFVGATKTEDIQSL